VAKAVNRIRHRGGRVWADRHHTRELRTPREVRNALVYVLTNWTKPVRNTWGLAPASSPPVVAARRWLAQWGWRRHGLVDPRERPRYSGQRRRSSSESKSQTRARQKTLDALLDGHAARGRGSHLTPPTAGCSYTPVRDVLDRLDRAHLVHGFGSPAVAARQGALRIVRGRGIHVWDADGKRYVDGLAGLWNVGVGHGRGEIARAVADQTKRLAFVPTLLGFTSEPAIRLAARLARLAPPGLRHVVFTSGGSESNETVIRLVRLHRRLRGQPDKIGIVALEGAYHGSSTGAASLTGLPTFHHHYGPLMPDVHRAPRPYCYRCPLGLTHPACKVACVDALERVVVEAGPARVGAVIVEPVQGVGGVVVPPPGWFERLRAICDRHDLLLVVDEVITGFGRTGKMFGIQHTTVVPDMLVFAKGVTSGYQPLGGVMLHDRVWDVLLSAGDDFVLHHGFTYSGHPVACAAALANLDIIERERLVADVRRKAPHFRSRLEALQNLPIVGEVRSRGLMAALEIVRDRTSREPFPAADRVPLRIREAALRRGLIVRASGDLLVLCPPLVITPAQIDGMARVLRAAIAEVVGSLELPASVAGDPRPARIRRPMKRNVTVDAHRLRG
jgi:putrescine aminotransferase